MEMTLEMKLEEFRTRIINAIINDGSELELSEDDNGKNLKQLFAEHTAKIIAKVPATLEPEVDDIIRSNEEFSSSDEMTQNQKKEDQ